MKCKKFTKFIKQDFDVTKDYKEQPIKSTKIILVKDVIEALEKLDGEMPLYIGVQDNDNDKMFWAYHNIIAIEQDDNISKVEIKVSKRYQND